ncbi:hypothetical protein WJX72_007573 [[Myrmecia] bisecta]|uniref:PUB domain-containing protein n=1 Tax=[Myrmecia] bisecta TaxID=41462 RepID=A0AAW1R7X1_9CHLO
MTSSHDIIQLREGLKKSSKLLFTDLMDFRHNGPERVEQCVATLLKMLSNVIEHPEEEKYRKIRATNAAFMNKVEALPASIPLLSALGWHVTVDNHEKYWVFDAPAGSLRMRILEGGVGQLQDALRQVSEKAKRNVSEAAVKKAQLEERRKKALLLLEEDQKDRKEMFTYAAGSAPSLVSEPTTAAAPAEPLSQQELLQQLANERLARRGAPAPAPASRQTTLMISERDGAGAVVRINSLEQLE